tara:strand:+ start:33 stop:473 length:441 start_codon:yes stop_codon:yes gene_type:complete
MALTKVNRGGLNTGISDSSNATFLTIDSSEQAVIKSEGGAVTTSVQQGLAKVYVHVDQRSTQTIQGSFNVGSITDNATGVTITNYTNNMNDALYSVVGSCDGAIKAYYQHQFYSETTSSVYTYNSPDQSLSNADNVVCTAILGDLA